MAAPSAMIELTNAVLSIVIIPAAESVPIASSVLATSVPPAAVQLKAGPPLLPLRRKNINKSGICKCWKKVEKQFSEHADRVVRIGVDASVG